MDYGYIKLEDSYKKQNVKTKNKRELMFLPYIKRPCYLILTIVIFPVTKHVMSVLKTMRRHVLEFETFH